MGKIMEHQWAELWLPNVYKIGHRSPRFEPSHWLNFIMNIFIVNVEKTQRKEKRGREWSNFL